MGLGIQIDRRLLKISSLNPVHFQNKKALPHFAIGLFLNFRWGFIYPKLS